MDSTSLIPLSYISDQLGLHSLGFKDHMLQLRLLDLCAI